MGTKPNSPEEEFSPAIRAAFDSYPAPKPDAEFDARFWRELDARKNRYRGFKGFWRRVVEVEIEGVTVWRLGVSTLSGGVLCLLVLGIGLQFWAPQSVSASPSPTTVARVPRAGMFAFSLRQGILQDDLWPDEKQKPFASSRRPTLQGDNFSCTRSNAPWA